MANVSDTCRKRWKRLGVRRAEAAEMVAELEAELDAAAQDGVTPERFIGGDARAFATEWAVARDVVRPRPRVLSSTLAALAGASPGVSFGLFIAYGVSGEAFAESFPGIQEYLSSSGSWLLLVLYTLGALYAYGGAIAGVAAWLRWQHDPASRTTIKRLAIGLPLGTAVAIAATIGFASTRQFSTSASVVLAEALVATTVFALSVGAIRISTLVRR